MAVFDLTNPFGSASGTSGDDIFNLHEGGAIYAIDGGAGIDTVSFGKAQYYRYVILPPDGNGVIEVDSVSSASWYYVIALKNVEFATWDNGHSVVDLSTWFNPITGTAGDDILYGRPNMNDTILGLAGNDIFVGSTGNNLIDGGPGLDTASYSSVRANYVFDLTADGNVRDLTGKDGTDTLSGIEILRFTDLSVHFALNDTLDTLVNGKDIVHVADGARLSATVNGAWTAGSESLNDGTVTILTPGLAVNLSAITAGKGYALTNTGAGTSLKGSGLDDTITLGVEGVWGSGYAALNDGSPGVAGTGQKLALDGLNRFADVLDGGNGADTLDLTAGNDAFFLHDAYSLFSSGTALANDGRGMPSTARLGNIEVIHAGAGNDLIDLTSPNYAIAGVLIDGGAGNDILWGNAGDDTILGGEGNDVIFGGAGHNTLSGGAGSDSFQYVKTGTAHDVIQDFLPGTDFIQLFGAASVSEVTVALSGGHVVLTWGTQTIELTGITSTTGSNGWFQLG